MVPGKTGKEEKGNSKVSYCQLKFKMADYTIWTGDYLLMRAEEMVLIQAEAECHLKEFDLARATISGWECFGMQNMRKFCQNVQTRKLIIQIRMLLLLR